MCSGDQQHGFGENRDVCVAWLKGWAVGLEIDHYSCDPLEICGRGKKGDGAFVAFLTGLELASVLLRLSDQVICLR